MNLKSKKLLIIETEGSSSLVAHMVGWWCRLENLVCIPLKVSGPNPPDDDFCGLVHLYGLCSGFK